MRRGCLHHGGCVVAASAPDPALTHASSRCLLHCPCAAGLIIGVCLIPFMCICLIWAVMYGKRTAGTSDPAYEKAAAAKVEEAAPVAAEEAPAPVEEATA